MVRSTSYLYFFTDCHYKIYERIEPLIKDAKVTISRYGSRFLSVILTSRKDFPLKLFFYLSLYIR